VEIFTDSKELLREAIQRTEARQTAHELLWEEAPELPKANQKQEKPEGMKQKESERNQNLVLKVPPKQQTKDRGISI
jgi:hypothetical protein